MKSYQIEIHPISMTRQPAKSLSVKVTKQGPILLKENATIVITTMIKITKMIIITIMILLLSSIKFYSYQSHSFCRCGKY